MARAPDKNKAKGLELSPKLQEIKKQLDEGRYQVDLEALAGALLDAGALADRETDEPFDAAAAMETEDSVPRNDQKPKND